MTIIERVQKLQLPQDQSVVIGSGILDALKLRTAGDVDLVVTTTLFEVLSDLPNWHRSIKHDEPMLSNDDTEVFMSWGSEGVPNFQELYASGITIEGVRFADPQFVIGWKRQRMSDKDKRDIALLEGYLKG